MRARDDLRPAVKEFESSSLVKGESYSTFSDDTLGLELTSAFAGFSSGDGRGAPTRSSWKEALCPRWALAVLHKG